MKKVMFAAICAAVAGVAAAQQERRAPVVKVMSPVEVSQGQPKTYVGTVKASERVGVTARIVGEIWKQNFKEGGVVRKDQVLFEIEDTVYKANLQAAKASLAELEARLAFAETEVQRYRECLEKKSVSKSDYDRQVLSRDTLKANIDAAKARVTLCENDVKYTKVLCPMDGQIGETLIRPGNNVSPESGVLVTIVQYDPIQIQFAMSEADYFRAFDGQKLKGSVEMGVTRADGAPLDRRISIDFVDNQVDRATGTLMIQLACENSDRSLIPGGYVKVSLTEKFDPAVLAVPVSSLVIDGGKTFVYVVDGSGVARKTPVECGSQLGDMQLLRSGLKSGDRVITAGLHKVSDGSAVVAK